MPFVDDDDNKMGHLEGDHHLMVPYIHLRIATESARNPNLMPTYPRSGSRENFLTNTMIRKLWRKEFHHSVGDESGNRRNATNSNDFATVQDDKIRFLIHLDIPAFSKLFGKSLI